MGPWIGKLDNPFKKKQKEVYHELLSQHLGPHYFTDKNKHRSIFASASFRRHSLPVADQNLYLFSNGVVTEKLDRKKSRALLDKIKSAGIKVTLPPSVPQTSFFKKQPATPSPSPSPSPWREAQTSQTLQVLLEEPTMPDSCKRFNELFEKKKSLLEPNLIKSLQDNMGLMIKDSQIKKEETLLQHYREKRKESENTCLHLKRPISKSELTYPMPFFDLEEEEDDEEIEEDIDEENVEIDFPGFTPEMEQNINDALIPTPPNHVLSETRSIRDETLTVTRKDMETLAGLNWLNDEIINFYFALIVERGKLDNRPSVYAFNTFFYSKLKDSGHSAVKRWTRKVDIFSYDFIFVPVHLGMHWCLAVIDFGNKQILYYDSMGGKNHECLQALRNYLELESLDKKKCKFNMSDWQYENVKDIPQQMNGSDCGMFTCKYAEYISRRCKFNFTQAHMPYFRRRMVYEILIKQLL